MGSDRLSSCNYKLYAGYFKFQHAIEIVLGELAWVSALHLTELIHCRYSVLKWRLL